MDSNSLAANAKRKAYWNVVLPLFITSIIAYLDRVNLSYASLTMQLDLGFDASAMGMGASVFFLGYVLFEIPGALIAERYSPKWWIARIMLSWGIVSGLMAFVTTAWQFYLLRFLLGIAEASLYPVLYASCIPRWFAIEDRARAIAIMLTSLQISSIIGAPLAGSLLDLTLFGWKGWQMLFLLEAIPAILFAAILVWWMADSPAQAKWLTDDEKKFLITQYEASLTKTNAVHRFTFWQAVTDREVLKLCLAYFFWITGFWGFNYWMPTALKSASGWSNIKVGWMIVIPMGLSLGFMCWIGHHSSSTGEKRWHGAIGMFIAAVGMLIGTLTDNTFVAFVCVCLAAIGVYAPFGVWWSYPTTFLSGTAAAGAIGLINSCGNLGGCLGPSVTGFLKDTTGSFTIGWIYLTCSLTAAGLLTLTLGKKESV